MRFRNEVTSRPWAIMKRIGEHTLQIIHCPLCSIYGKGLATAQIAKTAAVIQAHDVIGMRMGEDDSVQPADVFAQHLNAKFRRRIDYQPSLAGFNINRGPGAMVFGIGEEFRRVFFADHRHALRGSRAEKNEEKRHLMFGHVGFIPASTFLANAPVSEPASGPCRYDWRR